MLFISKFTSVSSHKDWRRGTIKF